jgi:capsular polysaccharide biosynthesis protein
MRPTRAAFTLCRTQSTASSLFVFPHGYQYFQRDTGASLKSARSRKFSRSILRYERKNVSRAIVIIQDTFDGGSLAHFLLDWLPRIAYFIEAKVEPLQSTLFVLGGIPNEFHKKLLEALHCKYGLNDENVFFPQERMILDIAGPIYFFSDQVQAPLHPAHMAHPNSIEIIRDAINHITRDKGPYPRIFISRADATLRKIINEPEIESQLQAHGFKALRLSEYDVTTQLSLIRGAEIVVGAHGMGFTHSIAHDGGLKMLELFHPRIGSDAYIFIGKALSFGYRYLIGRDVADGLGSYKVDTNEVMVELKAFLSENAST